MSVKFALLARLWHPKHYDKQQIKSKCLFNSRVIKGTQWHFT